MQDETVYQNNQSHFRRIPIQSQLKFYHQKYTKRKKKLIHTFETKAMSIISSNETNLFIYG